MMSVHDALEAWQNGEISTSRAMALSGGRDVLELYALAEACEVELRFELSEAEAQYIDGVTAAIQRAIERSTEPAGPEGAEAA
jgi:hypothetical protein